MTHNAVYRLLSCIILRCMFVQFFFSCREHRFNKNRWCAHTLVSTCQRMISTGGEPKGPWCFLWGGGIKVLPLFGLMRWLQQRFDCDPTSNDGRWIVSNGSLVSPYVTGRSQCWRRSPIRQLRHARLSTHALNDLWSDHCSNRTIHQLRFVLEISWPFLAYTNIPRADMIWFLLFAFTNINIRKRKFSININIITELESVLNGLHMAEFCALRMVLVCMGLGRAQFRKWHLSSHTVFVSSLVYTRARRWCTVNTVVHSLYLRRETTEWYHTLVVPTDR